MRIMRIAAIAALATGGAARADGEFCQSQYRVAEKVMTNRQGGIPLTDMLKVNATYSGLTALERQLYDAIVVNAYERPLFGTDDAKREAITEYANGIMLACLRGATMAEGN